MQCRLRSTGLKFITKLQENLVNIRVCKKYKIPWYFELVAIFYYFGGKKMIVYCPFCSSIKNVSLISYETDKGKYSICNRNKIKSNSALYCNRNYHYMKDYNGKLVKKISYDRYCLSCHKPFYYMSNLLVGDIKQITFIIQTANDRWKYEINIDNNNYNVDHNYFTKEIESTLTPARKRKILEGIDKSKLLYWKPLKEKNYFDYKIRWNIYITFNNEQTYSRGGYDEYPEEWSIFIVPFIKVFKNDIFKKMKS